MRILGIDFGEKQIGVALSDESNKIAMPYCVINTGQQDHIINIKSIVKKENIDKIVVGMPLNMNGTMGKRAFATERFIQGLKDTVGVEVCDWDERLSTRFSDRLLNDANIKGRKNKKKSIDMIAAAFILQGYLDYINNEKI